MRLLFILLASFFCSYLSINKTPDKFIYKPVLTRLVAAEDKYPVPPDNANRLFYIQRTPNTNTIIYELNARNGQVDEENPINVYWLKYAVGGQREELNYVQRKFAYGIITKKLSNERYDVRFVSYKKFPLLLMKANDGKYHIFATVEQKQMMLNRIFINIEGGTFWLPNIVYVEFKGTDPLTGKELVQRFKP